MNKSIEKVPVYSLAYLINGDSDGITDEEVALIDQWCKRIKLKTISPITDADGYADVYFTSDPAFGLPADVMDCVVIRRE